jgi:hypothetical protein
VGLSLKTVPGALLGCILAAGLAMHRAPADDPPLDDMQQSVVDSLAATPRTTAPEFLDAALRAADVDAGAVAEDYFTRVLGALDEAGDGRLNMLAELGDSADPAALARLERILSARKPPLGRVVATIRAAGRERGRDARLLARAAEDLHSPEAATRLAAAERLASAGPDALPHLVALLRSDDAAGARARGLARELIGLLGADARQPLLAWLGSGDVDAWPGVIAALDASGATDIEAYLLAPATVKDSPPAVRAAATAVLRRRAAARREDVDAVPPPRDMILAMLTERLDRTLAPAALPAADRLAGTGDTAGTVEKMLWNPAAGRFDRVALPPQAARALDAAHLARDLAALGAGDPGTVNLVLLAQLEGLLAASGPTMPDVATIPKEQLRQALSGPTGFATETAGDVLDLAIDRDMRAAAAAAAAALETSPPLPPSARQALVRALAYPDAQVQFQAARSLALSAGDPPYRGSSRVLDVLLHAATSTGVDRVIVAHPEAVAAHALATGVARFGYDPLRVATGRDAILAARRDADVTLVLLSARITKPVAVETVQFLAQQPLGDPPPVLLVVDPLDEDCRGMYLARLAMTFGDVRRLAVVDRFDDSLFAPRLDERNGRVLTPARFPDAVAQVGGVQAAAPQARSRAATARQARGREALDLLGRLGRRGWDVTPAIDTARRGLLRADHYAPAVSLLATIGAAAAQQDLLAEAQRADTPRATRALALANLETSIDRYGILLETGHVRAAYRMYNQASDDASRDAFGAVLDALETAARRNRPAPFDAASTRPTR